MKILFIGDVVSQAGRSILALHLKTIKQKHQIDFTIINGENIAHGKVAACIGKCIVKHKNKRSNYKQNRPNYMRRRHESRHK